MLLSLPYESNKINNNSSNSETKVFLYSWKLTTYSSKIRIYSLKQNKNVETNVKSKSSFFVLLYGVTWKKKVEAIKS